MNLKNALILKLINVYDQPCATLIRLTRSLVGFTRLIRRYQWSLKVLDYELKYRMRSTLSCKLLKYDFKRYSTFYCAKFFSIDM